MGDFGDDMYELEERREEKRWECEKLSDSEITSILHNFVDEDGEELPLEHVHKTNSICEWFKSRGYLTPKQRSYLNHVLFNYGA